MQSPQTKNVFLSHEFKNADVETLQKIINEKVALFEMMQAKADRKKQAARSLFSFLSI